MNEPLNIRLANRGMYESGSADGIWLKLPATAEHLNTALKRIGVNSGEHGVDYFITAIESTIPVIDRIPVENIRRSSINELNYIAGQLEKADPTQIEKLSASLEGISGINSVNSLNEFSQNSDYFTHYPNIQNHEQLGKHVLEMSGLIQMPEQWADAVNLEKLGKIAAAEDKGVFTEKGYTVPNANAWETFTEIPQDYIIEKETESRVNELKRPPPDRMYDAAPATLAAPTAAMPIAAAPIVLIAENTFDKVKEITGKLEKGVKDIFESGQYKSYLDTLSKFHNYSSNNCILIAMQKPSATHVAGFNTWRDHFKRHVKKGEKGIKILAPAPYKTMKEVNNQQVEVTMPAYKVVSVFDVSQTYGEPLPKIGKDELTGDVDKYTDFLNALQEVSPVPVSFESLENGAKGYYSQTEKRIAINEGMSELQNLKTTIHEMAHSRLHDRDLNAPENTTLPDSRTREIEAESIAYTVCQRYGLDTSDYSFGYIAEWSGDKQMDALKSSLDTIRKEANSIITEVDKHFKEFQKETEHDKALARGDIQATLQQQAKEDMTKYGKVMPWTKEEMAANGYQLSAIGRLEVEKIPVTDAPKQHHSTAVQITVDTSGKAVPPTATTTARSNEPNPAQGENVAEIEARVKAGETINLTELSDAIKKDKQTAQSKQTSKAAAQPTQKPGTQTKPRAQEKKPAKTAPEKKPSIREELAASKRQAAAQKTAAKSKSKDLEV